MNTHTLDIQTDMQNLTGGCKRGAEEVRIFLTFTSHRLDRSRCWDDGLERISAGSDGLEWVCSGCRDGPVMGILYLRRLPWICIVSFEVTRSALSAYQRDFCLCYFPREVSGKSTYARCIVLELELDVH